MHISEFDYELPPELIAQEPLAERDRSRMLVVNRGEGAWQDRLFTDLPDFLRAGDVVVINNTRVFPARLLGHRVAAGAAVETFLLTPLGPVSSFERDGHVWQAVEWEVLARPGRALRVGASIEYAGGRLRGQVLEILEEGRRRIRFEAEGNFDQVVDEIGQTPLPPYIKREASETNRLVEPRYQTIYASRRGAVAAPTAGLHFTPTILDRLRGMGVQIVEITHHVGYATFQPVRVEEVEEHRIEAESYEISEEAAQRINEARRQGYRIVAIGTTSVRALESAADEDGTIRAERSQTELYIFPGYRFRAVDALLTNFHLPKSSLLMLVSAFGGRELVLGAYRHAVDQRYRFYSYGDCMLLI